MAIMGVRYMAVMVVDSVMGSGKSTNMLKFMEENSDKRFLYVSPFKSEVGDGNTGVSGRLQTTLPDMFPKNSMPKNVGEGKIESLKRLLQVGGNVATTHALFQMFDDEVVDLILEKGYVVVIDESVECIQLWDDLTKKEVKALIDSEWIRVGEDGIVEWNDETMSDYDGRYNDVRSLAQGGGLRLFKDNILVVEYSPRLLKECKECYVLTYLLEGSLMHSWMKVNDISFEYADNGVFGLSDAKTIKEHIRKQLTVLGSRKLDNKYSKESQIKYRYSSTWYKDTSTVADRLEVRKALESCVNNHKTPESRVFWTTFKDHREKLEGKGYKKGWVDPDTGDELESFLPFNAKAINDYRHHDLVMHTVNLFRNPKEIQYLKSRGVEFNEDLWACSELLQFIWRSRIRQGQSTKVLVISKRMRNLLIDWLKEDT